MSSETFVDYQIPRPNQSPLCGPYGPLCADLPLFLHGKISADAYAQVIQKLDHPQYVARRACPIALIISFLLAIPWIIGMVLLASGIESVQMIGFWLMFSGFLLSVVVVGFSLIWQTKQWQQGMNATLQEANGNLFQPNGFQLRQESPYFSTFHVVSTMQNGNKPPTSSAKAFVTSTTTSEAAAVNIPLLTDIA